MINFTKQANADEVLINLLKYYQIPVDPETITNELNTHPDYPSLLSINDVALNFGLDCGAYQIAKEDLKEIPCPFVANTSKRGSEFMLVTGINTNTVTTGTNSFKKKINYQEFEAGFTGVIMAVDEDEAKSLKPDTINPISKIISSSRYFLAPLLLVLALVAGLFLHFDKLNNITWPYVFLLLFKSAGVVASILLLIQSIEQNNPLIQKLCGGGGKTNCNTILTSKAATVFKGLSWSEVGFFYFTGTWLYFCLAAVQCRYFRYWHCLILLACPILFTLFITRQK